VLVKTSTFFIAVDSVVVVALLPLSASHPEQ
jgi:hypothetical protein